MAPVITESLTRLFNLSLQTGVFPSDWKRACVTPIFKNRGDKQCPSNYRPVSILPALGKILDSIQSTSLLQYLTKHHLLSDHQFGFRPNLSTTKQLVYITNKWLTDLDRKEPTLAIFMDFHKAFDKVWHSGLLYNLGQCGVTNAALQWIADYLTDRTVAVKVGNSLSDEYPLSAGVPQGSHLGPVLFLIFINDLPTSVASPTELYADDALIHDVKTSTERLQISLDTSMTWAKSWRGTFSPAKTVSLYIGSPMDHDQDSHQLEINGQALT